MVARTYCSFYGVIGGFLFLQDVDCIGWDCGYCITFRVLVHLRTFVGRVTLRYFWLVLSSNISIQMYFLFYFKVIIIISIYVFVRLKVTIINCEINCQKLSNLVNMTFSKASKYHYSNFNCQVTINYNFTMYLNKHCKMILIRTSRIW